MTRNTTNARHNTWDIVNIIVNMEMDNEVQLCIPVSRLRRQHRILEIFNDPTASLDASSIDRELLRSRARWIRDDLDPSIAFNGPSVLSPDSVVVLYQFLEQLRRVLVPANHLRWSRIHHAILLIVGRATRWPSRIIEEADAVIEVWNKRYGVLTHLRPLVYEEGGRLHGISTPMDLSKDALYLKWLNEFKLAPGKASEVGDIGFKPGDWWINRMYAHREGVVDGYDEVGGLIWDKNDTYALVLDRGDEMDSPHPEIFTYRTKSHENGRYKLTAGTQASRHPIRVLRSHTLRSLWAPKAGLRYDGLYKVVAWSVVFDIRRKIWSYDVKFQRLETEVPMEQVLKRPWAEEVDDYKEYKRLRQIARMSHAPLFASKPLRLLGSPDVANQHPNSNGDTMTLVNTFGGLYGPDHVTPSKGVKADLRR